MKQNELFVQINTNHNEKRDFFPCGGDDYCGWYDGWCNPKYH